MNRLLVVDDDLQMQAAVEAALRRKGFAVETASSGMEAAQKLDLTVPALKSELHRLRQRFKTLVRQEVANTVSAPHEIDEEMTHLQQVLMDRGHDFESALKPPPPSP